MIPDEFQRLLLKRLPGAQVKITSAPSGAFMASIFLGTRVFVMEYQPKVGFGVSRCSADDLLFASHDIQVQTVEEALATLERFIFT